MTMHKTIVGLRFEAEVTPRGWSRLSKEGQGRCIAAAIGAGLPVEEVRASATHLYVTMAMPGEDMPISRLEDARTKVLAAVEDAAAPKPVVQTIKWDLGDGDADTIMARCARAGNAAVRPPGAGI